MKVEEIIAKAQAATGLTDMGDPSALENLKVLVKASNEEAELSAAGAPRWEGLLVNNLINRLRIVDYLKQHPQLLERPIEKPMFVFGLPRTGTTLTINLLTADPMRRSFMRWEALNPVPPAKAGELHSDPRYYAEQEKLAMSLKYMPQIAAIHYEDADSPTECQFNMSATFLAQVYDSQAYMPSYSKWFFEADFLPTFKFHKQFLQLLQENNGGRWTLKNPWHPLFLDALTAVYPDAQLVMTHRDPAEVVGSACSLIRHVRPVYSDKVDLKKIGEWMMYTFDQMIARQNAFRDQRGEGVIFDIQYEEQMRDPIGTMRKVYANFGEALSPAAEAAMTQKMSENPQGKHGKHVYSLEEFGLTKEGVRKHYKDYIDRFRIQLKG